MSLCWRLWAAAWPSGPEQHGSVHTGPYQGPRPRGLEGQEDPGPVLLAPPLADAQLQNTGTGEQGKDKLDLTLVQENRGKTNWI